MSAQTKTTEPTITVPAPLFRALFAAAQAVCDDARAYGINLDDEVCEGHLITALRAALEPLKEVGATPAQPLDRRYRPDIPSAADPHDVSGAA
jgi:hypothetical protein